MEGSPPDRFDEPEQSGPQLDLTPGEPGELDSLALLHEGLGKRALLTPEEVIDLGRRIQHGDMAARERMIEANQRLVYSIARSFTGQGLPLSDVFQNGMIGLITATDGFDPEKGFRFSSYATQVIVSTIVRENAKTAYAVKLPDAVRQKFVKIMGMTRFLETELQRTPTLKEIADITDIPVEEILELQAGPANPLSLDAPVGEEGDGATRQDFVPAETSVSEEAHSDLEQAEQAILIEQALETLTEMERTIIRARHLSTDGSKPTYEQIGEQVGLNFRHVQAIEQQALRKLSSNPWLWEYRQ